MGGKVKHYGFVELFINVQRIRFFFSFSCQREPQSEPFSTFWDTFWKCKFCDSIFQITMWHIEAHRKRGPTATHVSKVWSNYLLNIITVFRS